MRPLGALCAPTVGESKIRLDSRTRSVLRTASLSQVAIDGTAVKITGNWSSVYDAIDLDSRLILDVAVFGRRGTDSAAAFLHRLIEKHDLFEMMFLVGGRLCECQRIP
ncbi:integrase [Haloterrigena salina JCM 13891]|uniref:Integrase n=1 Tax=Haloterrigena salina JCM 13891 TaxID=1227488 RepID=M0BZS0_9EURY|nr:integrase [Haloterrigena salina JCM 13891]